MDMRLRAGDPGRVGAGRGEPPPRVGPGASRPDRFRSLLPLLALLASTVPSDVAGQVVRGTVVAVGDGSAIPDARLILRDPEGMVRAVSVSGADGQFLLAPEEGGPLRLEVIHLAYADFATSTFLLESGEDVEIEVKLGIEAIPLAPITVVASATRDLGRLAGFEQRRSNPAGGGYFIVEEDIERRPIATTSSLVAQLPGMGVASATGGFDRNVILAGSCVAAMYIDGVRVRQTADHTVDDLLVPEIIAGVEVYPRAMAAPAQYRGSSTCGVVLFWTKEPEPTVGGSRGFGRVAVGLGLLAAIITLGIIR